MRGGYTLRPTRDREMLGFRVLPARPLMDTYVLQLRWANAVEAYRRSVDLYRQVVEIRSRAARRKAGHPSDGLHVITERMIVGDPLAAELIEDPPPRSRVVLAALTAREREVAQLIAGGYTNQQIAEALVITRGTVANHVAHILSKLDLTNRTQLAAYVTRQERTSPPTSPRAVSVVE